jgi:DNA polymerase I-like protein with 3'-5' exonuclease and polymerase domains
MLVTPENFDECFRIIFAKNVVAVDTEGYGSHRNYGGRLFSIIIGDEEDTFYFNFKDYPDEGVVGLGDRYLRRLSVFFEGFRRYIFHNAKYDLGVLRREGIEVGGKIHDTMVVERLLDSRLFGKVFSLSATAKRYGLEKSDEVEKYVSDNKLFTLMQAPGKKTKDRIPHYDKVPMSIIQPYGETDQIITFGIYKKQLERLKDIRTGGCQTMGNPKIGELYREEMELVRTCFDVEWGGIRIDTDFCDKAIEHESSLREEASRLFTEISGVPFVDSHKPLSLVFASDKDRWVLGKPTKVKKERNPKFDSEILASFSNPAAKHVISMRDAKAKENQYLGFKYYSDEKGQVHTSLNQYQASSRLLVLTFRI